MAIISFSRRFIFLKTRKVAGTSVEALIRPYLGDDDVVPAVTPRDEFYCASKGAFSRNYLVNSDNEAMYTGLVLEGRFDEAAKFLQSCKKLASSHMSFFQIQKLLERKGFSTDDFWVFTIDRHPYDWLLSTILYDNSLYNKTGDALSKRNLDDVNRSAKSYLSRPDIEKKLNWCMYTKNDRLLVDQVLKYETLREDMSEVLITIIPECDISEMPELKKNKSGLSGTTAFSDEIKELVQCVFSPVFDRLNYQK